jgi:deoxycytidylate deaminase
MIRIAIKEAHKSTSKEYKHGALMVKGGNIISSGYNHGTIHAEIHALSKIWSNKIKGGIIISVRINKTGFGNSKPCSNCRKTMQVLGINKIIYFKDKEWRSERC